MFLRRAVKDFSVIGRRFLQTNVSGGSATSNYTDLLATAHVRNQNAATKFEKLPEYKFVGYAPNLITPLYIPEAPIQRIEDPSRGTSPQIDTPITEIVKDDGRQQSDNTITLDLPAFEGQEKIIEAAVMVEIRRLKMKKHKLKKLRKKMKFVYAKRRQRRKMRKEKEFQATLMAQMKQAEQFSAEAYVNEKLAKLKSVPQYEPEMMKVF